VGPATAPVGCPDAPAPSSAPNPRAAVVATLAGHVAALAAAGDLEGARVVHETLGKLLGAAGEASRVVDLETERRKRGGQ
jgi:hypothetical protein